MLHIIYLWPVLLLIELMIILVVMKINNCLFLLQIAKTSHKSMMIVAITLSNFQDSQISTKVVGSSNLKIVLKIGPQMLKINWNLITYTIDTIAIFMKVHESNFTTYMSLRAQLLQFKVWGYNYNYNPTLGYFLQFLTLNGCMALVISAGAFVIMKLNCRNVLCIVEYGTNGFYSCFLVAFVHLLFYCPEILNLFLSLCTFKRRHHWFSLHILRLF